MHRSNQTIRRLKIPLIVVLYRPALRTMKVTLNRIVFMKISPHPVVVLVTSLLLAPAIHAGTASAQTATPAAPTARQDLPLLRQGVEQFLQRQASGLPGQVSIDVGQIDPRLNLPACMQPEPFLAHGSRAWGKTSVGIRCTAPSPWTIYVTANVHVMADYVATAVPLAQGQMVGNNDLTKMRGDLTTLPSGVITDPSLAVGRTTMSSLQLGAPLRQDMLRAQAAVQMGQTIRLLSSGPGFRVTTEAKALNNATEGQTVQARTVAGLVISGIAKAGGILEVSY